MSLLILQGSPGQGYKGEPGEKVWVSSAYKQLSSPLHTTAFSFHH